MSIPNATAGPTVEAACQAHAAFSWMFRGDPDHAARLLAGRSDADHVTEAADAFQGLAVDERWRRRAVA